MMRSKSARWAFVACTIAACGGRVQEADDAGPTTSGSGGTSGTGGPWVTDAAATGGTGATAGSSNTGGTGATGGSTGSGGIAGTGSSGSAGAGGSGQPPPIDDAGKPGTQPSCASIIGMLERNSFIAFDSDHDNFHRNLYIMHPDGSALSQLTRGLNNDREPFFSPDGKMMSFTSDVGGVPQIFLIKGNSLISVQLTKRPEGADESSFSRDGQWVAFHSGASVYIIKLDGTEEKRVATGLAPGTNAYHWPAFSADGTELAFDRYNEIGATKLDGTGFRYIVGNTTSQIKSPAVSPDGAEIAYQGGCYNDTGNLSVWTTPFATQTQLCMGRRVTPPDRYEAKNPAWATGAAIAYERVDKVTNLATIAIIERATGSTPCILTAAMDDSRNPTWSAYPAPGRNDGLHGMWSSPQ